MGRQRAVDVNVHVGRIDTYRRPGRPSRDVYVVTVDDVDAGTALVQNVRAVDGDVLGRRYYVRCEDLT